MFFSLRKFNSLLQSKYNLLYKLPINPLRFLLIEYILLDNFSKKVSLFSYSINSRSLSLNISKSPNVFNYLTLWSFSKSRFVVHGTVIEIVWTVIPSLILIIVALPSFALLYSIDEIVDPALTLKCIGNQ